MIYKRPFLPCLCAALFFLFSAPAHPTELEDWETAQKESLKSWDQQSWEFKYKETPALCMFEEADTVVNPDGTSSTRYRSVYKIQNESGKELGESTFGYDTSYQQITDLSAFVVMPDGRKLKYTKIQEVSENSGYPVYSNEKTKIISLPEVNVGCSVEREVTVADTKAQIDGNYFDIFHLSGNGPEKLMRRRVSFPGNMEVKIYSFNTDARPKVERKDGRVIYTWEVNDVAQGVCEDFCPPSDEMNPWVIITTVKQWKTISDWYWGLVSKNMVANDAIKAKVAELIRDKATGRDKVEAIINYLYSNFRYVSMNFGNNRYEPHPAAEVFGNKYGDCKDQVTLALTMLKEAGITAWPALYLGEMNGIIFDDAPSPQYFNHVIFIAEADGRTYYVDPLVDGYHVGETPVFMHGANLFVVTDKGGYRARIPVYPNNVRVTAKEETYAINPDGSAVCDQKFTFDRDDSLEYKKMFESMNEEDMKDFYKSFESSSQGSKIVKMTYSDIKDKYSPFVLRSILEIPNLATVQGDYLIVSPQREAPNMGFVTTERIYPVVFSASSLTRARNVYRLPNGYRVESLPEDVNISTKLLDFTVKYRVDGLLVTEETELRYKRGRLELKEYPQFKSVCDNLMKYKNKFIIAKKP